MISASSLARVRVTRKIAQAVDRALTSPAVVSQEVFEEPNVITSRYFNFNNLLLHRHKIRDLRLVPFKEEVLHGTYNALSRQELVERLIRKMGPEKLVLLENEYPYQLPSDVMQYILWIRHDETPRVEIVKFLARLMRRYKLDDLDVIFFERPTVSKSKYVKRSFPFMRHVHVWIRRKHDNELAKDG